MRIRGRVRRSRSRGARAATPRAPRSTTGRPIRPRPTTAAARARARCSCWGSRSSGRAGASARPSTTSAMARSICRTSASRRTWRTLCATPSSSSRRRSSSRCPTYSARPANRTRWCGRPSSTSRPGPIPSRTPSFTTSNIHPGSGISGPPWSGSWSTGSLGTSTSSAWRPSGSKSRSSTRWNCASSAACRATSASARAQKHRAGSWGATRARAARPLRRWRSRTGLTAPTEMWSCRGSCSSRPTRRWRRQSSARRRPTATRKISRASAPTPTPCRGSRGRAARCTWHLSIAYQQWAKHARARISIGCNGWIGWSG
mmetsp:Transcript_108093/g.314405  ORF Transcript_108093/g.314405 Transcript_108093/m.314405 type:complete len:316 (+) Transcript_108093:407-1354(+)